MAKTVRIKWRQVLISEMEMTLEEFAKHFPHHADRPLDEALEDMARDAADFEFDYDASPTLEQMLDEDHEILETSIEVFIESTDNN